MSTYVEGYPDYLLIACANHTPIRLLLQVSNEVEIFSAVAKWIDADKQGRASHLCPLLGAHSPSSVGKPRLS